MNNGFIVLHRKFMDWEWYSDSVMVHLFLHLLLKANHKDRRWRGLEIKRGQVVTGRKVLSEELNISEQKIRTALYRLENVSREITIKATNKGSIITICNYASYQDKKSNSNQQPNQRITNKQPTDNQQVTTNNNDNKEKQGEQVINRMPISGNDETTIREFYEEALTEQSWLELVARQNDHKNLDNTKRLLIQFCNQIKVDGEDLKKYSERKRHFSRWSSYKKNKKLVIKEVAI